MKKPTKAEWWRLNKKEKATYDIEWSPNDGGWCRARVDSITVWEYNKCPQAQHALSLGEAIITSQKRRRQ